MLIILVKIFVLLMCLDVFGRFRLVMWDGYNWVLGFRVYFDDLLYVVNMVSLFVNFF